MKKFITKICIAVVIIMLYLNTATAQTYFAGAGAGAGNSGTLATGVGTFALGSSNSGTANAAFGSNALFKNTAGASNTAIGANGLYNNTTGSFNVAVGRSALYSNIAGYNNTSAGYNSLYTNSSGYSNTALGYFTLKANTSGYKNTAVGELALVKNTSGILNTACGASSLDNNTTGAYNTAAGYSSLGANNDGRYNTAVGCDAASGMAGGDYNTVLGYKSLGGGSGNLFYNTVVGAAALTNIFSTSDSNVAIGFGAGGFDGYANACTFIGFRANPLIDMPGGEPLVMNIRNSTSIGNGAFVDSSNKVVIGNTAIISIGGQVGWTTYSDQRLKTNINKSKLGLDFIMALNPVTYNYKAEGQKDILYTGLIAQEVDEAAKKNGVAFSGVDKNGQYWGIRYGELTVPLIKAMQEMEEKQKTEVAVLNSRIEKLEAALSQKRETNLPAAEKSFLYQNQPNPFSTSTTIRYVLTAGDKSAVLILRDLNGKALKQVSLAAGKGSATINAGELSAGTYTYSLIITGECADTKLMVIAK